MKALIVDNIRSEPGRAAGAIELRRYADTGSVGGIAFRCPCGCGEESWLPVNRGDSGWDWDGNEVAPTLSPSVLQSGFPCRWHGYLRNGRWELS